MNQTTKLNKEQGRSMTEMLGVLAVVGVLSIGGIMGYNHAMDKNKANDLLDGISKSAMILAQKTMMGALIEEKTLTGTDGLSFGGYTVKSLAQEDGQSYFEIQATGIPENICVLALDSNLALSIQTDLGETLGENTIVWKNKERQSTAPACEDNDNNTITWLFDNNLDTTVEISLESADEDEEEEEEEEEEETSCSEGQIHDANGDCIDEIKSCPADQFWAGESCVACPTAGSSVSMSDIYTYNSCEKCSGAVGSHIAGGGYYGQYICTVCSQDKVCGGDCCESDEVCHYDGTENSCVTKCSSDSDCETGEKCMNGECVADTNDCSSNSDCRTLNTATTTYYCKLDSSLTGNSATQKPSAGTCTAITETEKDNKYSSESMNWWSAENFCDAIGSEMASISWLECSNGNGGTWTRSDYQAEGYGYCCAEGKTGASITASCQNGSSGRSSKIPSSNYYWLKDLKNSSSAFYVDYYGDVGNFHRSLNYYALCE